MDNNIKLLLTGFEPFGDFKVNPTEKIVRTLDEEAKKNSIRNLDVYILPVTERASEIVNSLLTKNYDYVVHIGLHGLIDDFAIEKVGINIDDYRIPDNSGVTKQDKPIDPTGKNAYFVKLPVRKIEEALKNKNVKCHLSYSAGTYLCNHLLYTSLNYIEKNKFSTKVGFIHIPNFDKMEFEEMLKGIKIILRLLGLNI